MAGWVRGVILYRLFAGKSTVTSVLHHFDNGNTTGPLVTAAAAAAVATNGECSMLERPAVSAEDTFASALIKFV